MAIDKHKTSQVRKRTLRVRFNDCPSHPFSECECTGQGPKRHAHIVAYLSIRYRATRRDSLFSEAKAIRQAHDIVAKAAA